MIRLFATLAGLLPPAIAAMSVLLVTSSTADAKNCWFSIHQHRAICSSTSHSGTTKPTKAAQKAKAIQAMEIAKARKKRAEARAKRWPWR